MVKIKASVFACDEVTVSLNGKLNAFGIYNTDITIPTDSFLMAQMIFVFLIDFKLQSSLPELKLHVKFPGDAVRETVLSPPPIEKLAVLGRKNVKITYPFLLNNIELKAGNIEVKVFNEDEEILAGGLVVTSVTAPPVDEGKHVVQ
jgi:hypothetical protein